MFNNPVCNVSINNNGVVFSEQFIRFIELVPVDDRDLVWGKLIDEFLQCLQSPSASRLLHDLISRRDQIMIAKRLASAQYRGNVFQVSMVGELTLVGTVVINGIEYPDIEVKLFISDVNTANDMVSEIYQKTGYVAWQL